MSSKIWKSTDFVKQYLSGVRGAIPLADVQIEIIIKLIEASSLKINTFLDIGSGDGILAAAILNRYPVAKGVLLDFSGPMIEAAENKLINYRDQLVFVNADLDDKNWINSFEEINETFSVIVSGFTIHHQPDYRKKEIYSEIYKLLEPGGIFLNLDHVSSQTEWLEVIFENYFVDSQYEFNIKQNTPKSREKILEQFFSRADKEANILAQVEDQCKWLRDIGYKDVDCYFKVFELALLGGRKPVKESVS